MAKTINIKSYDSAGVFIKNISDANFNSFKKTINGGLSNLTFKLARKVDNFNTNNDVSVGNIIEIWIIDGDTTSEGILIYKGYIEQQNIFVDGGSEYVEIVCFGLVSKLKNDILKSGSQTKLYTKATDGLTITVADVAPAEVADILKEIIDLYNINNPTFPIYYNPAGVSTIETTLVNMKYYFNAVGYLEAIERCREVAPQNWYWYMGSDNIIYFKPISSVADHQFNLSQHIKRITASKSADSVKNVILIYNGDATYKQYKDDASIAIYGRRVEQLTDSNIKDSTTMDNLGAAFINENKDPKIRIEVELIDNNESNLGYDIESINPGQTCMIVGLTPDENIFTENMIIKEVNWSLTKATIVIETEKNYNFDRLILDIERKLKDLTTDTGNIPETYT